MSVLSVTSAVTEVPGVNNAVEHLQELGDACVKFTTIWSQCLDIYKKSSTDLDLDQHINSILTQVDSFFHK